MLSIAPGDAPGSRDTIAGVLAPEGPGARDRQWKDVKSVHVFRYVSILQCCNWLTKKQQVFPVATASENCPCSHCFWVTQRFDVHFLAMGQNERPSRTECLPQYQKQNKHFVNTCKNNVVVNILTPDSTHFLAWALFLSRITRFLFATDILTLLFSKSPFNKASNVQLNSFLVCGLQRGSHVLSTKYEESLRELYLGPETELSFRWSSCAFHVAHCSRLRVWLGHALAADAMNATHISICQIRPLEVVFRKPWQRMLSGNYILSSNEEEEMWMLRSLLFSLRWHRSDDMSGAECCDLKHGPLGQERCWQVTLRVLDCFPQREVQWVGGAVSTRSLKAAKMCSFVKQLRCFLPS